jgi:adenylate kinase
VGKGTQGRRLAEANGWVLISTGEILRDAVARQTELGREAQRRINEGLLVPDDVMIGLVRDRSREPDAMKGFILDGFPRTVPQADALDAMLGDRSQKLDAVVSLAADENELVRRLGARRECPICKRAYNMVSAPPKDGRHCDDHPETELVQRADDATETVQKRLQVYRDQTAPLIEYYRAGRRLIEVPGIGSMEDVYRSLQGALSSVGGAG